MLRAGGVLAGLFLLLTLAVGRHPAGEAPRTSIAAIGIADGAIEDAVVSLRGPLLTGSAKVLDVAGKGIVTTPLAVGALLLLRLRGRTDQALAFAIAWLGSEAVQHSTKILLARGRPPAAVVAASGYAFPSGHATTAAVFAASIVLILPVAVSTGRWRWVRAAACAFAVAMASSRVVLGVHWASDVIGGSSLGVSCALLAFGAVPRYRRGPPSAAG